MTQEIERKFLIERDYSYTPAKRANFEWNILQGYLSTGNREVRIRQKWSVRDYFDTAIHRTLTVKTPTEDVRVRGETEIEIGEQEICELFAQCGDDTLVKVRYEYPRWEIDYLALLGGLRFWLGEIELAHPDERLPALPLGYRVIREVTGEPGLKNAAIATQSRRKTEKAIRGTLWQCLKRLFWGRQNVLS